MLSTPSVDSALAAAVADQSTDAFVVEPLGIVDVLLVS